MSRIGYAVGQILSRGKKELGYFDIEVYNGARWVSVETDEITVAAESLRESSQSRRYQSATSPIYEGEWIIHAPRGNVQEQISLYLTAAEQIGVDDHIEDMIELFSQTYYQVRISRGNSVEIWNCFPAEYSIDRSHIQSHSVRAVIKLSIPRLPRVVKEVRP